MSQAGQKGEIWRRKNPDAFTLWGGNLKEILMHSRFYFAGTASIHFHNALSFVNMMSPAISVYFQLNSLGLTWRSLEKIIQYTVTPKAPMHELYEADNVLEYSNIPKEYILSLSTAFQLSPEKWKEMPSLYAIKAQNLIWVKQNYDVKLQWFQSGCFRWYLHELGQ